MHLSRSYARAMAQSDLELLQNGFGRLATEGYKAMVPLIHPEFVMETPAALAAEPQRYEGVNGFRRWWTSFLEVMETVELEPKSFEEIEPDKFAVETVMRAVGGARGIETTQEVVMIVTVRESQMIRIDFALSVEAARAGETA